MKNCNGKQMNSSGPLLPVIMPQGARGSPRRKNQTISISPIIENGPISPEETIKDYSSILMPYEIEEIKLYKNIYFLGYQDFKNPKDTDFYEKVQPKDHLSYRYEVIKFLGSGAFGKVIQAYDYKTKKQVAIKILLNAEQSQKEAAVLIALNKCKCSNTIKGLDYFLFRSHACISFELLGENLYKILENNKFKPMRQSIVREYAIQIFRALRDLSKIGIVHCDIKPQNICITLNDQRKVKVIDFGSSFSIEERKVRLYYIQSRFYRSPEVILHLQYDSKIDVWGAGLIILELLVGRPILQGKNELEMLNLMVQLLGPIPAPIYKETKKKQYFFNNDGTLKSSPRIDPNKRFSFKDLIGEESSPQLIDFLDRCLCWKTNLRMTASEALNHPWLKQK